MKTSVIFSTLAFVTAAFAVAIPESPFVEAPTKVKRDLATITSVIAQVSGAIVALDTAVKAYDGDKTELETQADALVVILESGKAAVDASSAISLIDALSLAGLVDSLQTLGETLVDDLVAQKPTVEAQSYCEEVEATIVEISTDARALVESIISKAPAIAQPIAEDIAEDFYAVLDEGASEFAPGNCVNAA